MEHCTGTPCAMVEIGREHYRTVITGDGHTIISDEPVELGGKAAGMNPSMLLLASLGSCTAITLRMYADRKNWAVDRIRVELSMETTRSDLQQTTYINRHIHVEGALAPDQRQRLGDIAGLCPLHKVLSNPVVISTNVVELK